MKDKGRVAEVVKSALDLSSEERARFIADACSGNEQLRAEVESLLHFQAEASDFIEEPALQVAAATLAVSDAALSTFSIAGYRIISKIGEGGMGDVYQAEDVELHRKVALKLVRPSMSTAEIVSRFRHEEQILAGLNHPNIAQLYGGGVTTEGMPFFVMEYVEGTRIDEYCRGKNLSIAERLQLFRKVCAAVHYAHQHLVIHRDLKPSNILVTESGEPKLLDFGIAKLLDPQESPAALTPTLPGVMTPDYASPEQVRGEPMSTATDVYSLGVILFELLTNERPYRTKSRRPEEVARAVVDEEPQARQIAGDLRNVALMALRKEPQRRYVSVAQFSDDIRRYLEGRPIVAHKDTLAYRARKFVRRNRAAVSAGALLVVAIAIGIGMTLREKNRAQRRFNDVRQLSNALLFDIAPKIERIEGATEARQALVSRALEYLDSLARESADDPQLQRELAAAYEKVGELQGAVRKPNLSDFAGAIRSYEKAQAIRRRSAPDPENLRRLASDYKELSTIRFWMNDYPGALRDGQEARQLYEQLLATTPESRELRLGWAESTLDIADTYKQNQQYARAYEYLEPLLRSLEESRRTAPQDRDVRHLLTRGYSTLAYALSWDGKQERAEVEMSKAIALGELLIAEHPDDVLLRHTLWSTYMQASGIYEESGDPAKDELSYRLAQQALHMARGTVERDPANTQARQSLGQSYSKLGVSAENLNRNGEAIAALEKALQVFSELERHDPSNRTYKRNLGIAFTRLGEAKNKEGDATAALDAFERSAACFQQVLEVDPASHVSARDIAQARKNIAEIHRQLAASAPADARPAHEQSASKNYERARELLLALEAQKALPAFDRKMLEEINAAVAGQR